MTLPGRRPTENTVAAGPRSDSFALSDMSTVAKNQQNPYGLTCVYDPLDLTEVDIIFVHGLGGGSFRTWSPGSDPVRFWPNRLLPVDIPQARLHTFGYNADFTSPRTANSQSVLDFAKQLLERMRVYSVPYFGEFPIIFVVHSMGGLIAKKALLLAQQELRLASIDGRFKRMVSNVTGILFLGTPHRGSDSAQLLENLLQLTLGSKAFIGDLKKGSQMLQAINEEFRFIADSYRLYSFYELRLTPMPGKFKSLVIVPQDSAVMGYRNERSIGVEADHHTICKFESRESGNYTLLRDVLLELIRNRQNDLDEDAGVPERSLISDRASGFTMLPLQDLSVVASDLLDDSCTWVLQKEYYTRWLESGMSCILWLHGLPGTGKTTLSTFLIDHLRSVQGSCDYYIFRSSNKSGRKVSAALLSIASQVSFRFQSIRATIAGLIATLKSDSADENTIWQKLFKNCIFRMKFNYPLYWVMDALDEAEKPELLLRFLADLPSKSAIKIFLTSRTGNEAVERAIHRVKKVNLIEGEITTEDTEGDISKFISTVLVDIYGDEGPKIQILARKLLEMSRGSFLWVTLALEKVREIGHTFEDADAALNEVPAEMDEMYRGAQQRIMNLDERQKRLAVRMLSFASLALRPLSLSEFTEFITAEPEFKNVINIEHSLKRLCWGFLFVDREKSVQWIHPTAREFLRRPNLDVFSIEREEFATKMASICLDFLYMALELDFKDPNGLDRKVVTLQQHALASYALESWSEHVRQSRVEQETVIDKLLVFFEQRSLVLVAVLFRMKRVPAVFEMTNNIHKFTKRYRSSNSSNSVIHGSTITSVDCWATDLARITTKFGKHIRLMPSALFCIIPKLCPEESMVRKAAPATKMSIIRTADADWNECISRFRPPNKLQISAITCNASYLALASVDGEICIFNPRSLHEVRRLGLQGDGKEVKFLELCDFESTLIATTSTGAYVWDLKSGTLIERCNLPEKTEILGVFPGLTRQGAHVVTIEGLLGLWKWPSSEMDTTGALNFLQHTDELGRSSVNNGAPLKVCISSDRRNLAVAYRGEKVQIWDLEGNYICSRVIRGDGRPTSGWGTPKAEDTASCFDFKPQTKQLIIGYQDGSLISWDPVTETAIQSKKQAEAVTLQCSPDGNFVVTGDFNGNLKIWTTDSLDLVQYIATRGDPIDFVCFEPSGLRFFDVRDTHCTAWEPESLVRARRMNDDDTSAGPPTIDVTEAPESSTSSTYSITALAVQAEHSLIAFATDTEQADVYLVNMLAMDGKAFRIASHGEGLEVYSLAWSEGGDFVVSADDSCTIIISETPPSDDRSSSERQKWILKAETRVLQALYDQRRGLVIGVTSVGYEIWDFHDGRDTFENLRATKVVQWAAGKGLWSLCPYTREKVAGGPFGAFRDILVLKKGEITLLPIDAVQKEPTFDGVVSSLDVNIGIHYPFPELPTVIKSVYGSFQGRSYMILEGYTESTGNSDILVLEAIVDTHSSDSTTVNWHFKKSFPNVESLIGCYRFSIIFLDKDMWICSIPLGFVDQRNFVRHFFIPSDWIDANAEQVYDITTVGDVVFTGKGEPVIVRGALEKVV
ncbi:hypothetical protein BJ508DRAFT_306459 [Ascobolus immersus RN42]|uniref:Uncharacterized protein n=1 Tax=Ascobolus immersus RN42 TaxID=1160509 RepID=A0A3N4I6B7_ASCIM|nr:hypothetical protein BJ508DRAFT_306459 [Ascobolus immersus RN42]